MNRLGPLFQLDRESKIRDFSVSGVVGDLNGENRSSLGRRVARDDAVGGVEFKAGRDIFRQSPTKYRAVSRRRQ